jgi:glycosyltransferase involved in cell wall biosynthesis
MYFDSRWTGHHGIARFARELRSRSKLGFIDFHSSLNPSSPIDVFNFGRLAIGDEAIFYSPGYNLGLARVKQFVTVHDLIHLSPSGRKSFAISNYYEKILKPGIRKSGFVFTVSEASSTAIRLWLGEHSDVQIVNLGNGISNVFLQVSNVCEDYDPRKFLFVGNLKPHKNIVTFIQAIKNLDKAKATFVVPPKDSTALHHLLSNIGLDTRFEIKSNLSDQQLRTEYRSSNALVMPSIEEGFGLPAAESLASNTPVVFWKGCKSLDEIVGLHGIPLSDPFSVPNLVSVLDSLMSNPSRVEPGLTWRANHEWGSVSQKLDSALFEISGQGHV